MTSMPESNAGAALRRWDRIAITVRCGYSPFCTCALKRYLLAGQDVVATGALPELRVHQRMLEVLLQTARDDGLPGYWRGACLEFSLRPLARLQSMLYLHDPIACQTLEGTVYATFDEINEARRGALRAWKV